MAAPRGGGIADLAALQTVQDPCQPGATVPQPLTPQGQHGLQSLRQLRLALSQWPEWVGWVIVTLPGIPAMTTAVPVPLVALLTAVDDPRRP